MCVRARACERVCVGQVLNFYPFLQKYMQPHQARVTCILAYAAQVRVCVCVCVCVYVRACVCVCARARIPGATRPGRVGSGPPSRVLPEVCLSRAREREGGTDGRREGGREGNRDRDTERSWEVEEGRKKVCACGWVGGWGRGGCRRYTRWCRPAL